MANCKNCYSSVDMRSGTSCKSCNEPLHKDCAINDGGTFCDVCHMAGASVQKEAFIIPDVIRRSNIELYRKCPYSFYLQVIKGLQAPPTIYTQLGIDLHELFDKASNDRSYLSYDMMRDYTMLYNAYPEEWKSQKMRDRAVTSIENYYKLLAKLPIKPFATEKTIQFSVGDSLPKVQITMDRIDQDEYSGNLSIEDYKTGVTMTGVKLETDMQSPLYINAVQREYQRTVSHFGLHYLNEDKERTFIHESGADYTCTVRKRIYRINLNKTITEVQSIFSKIQKQDFNIPRDIKGMFFTCKMCHFRENGTCQGAEVESWYKK